MCLARNVPIQAVIDIKSAKIDEWGIFSEQFHFFKALGLRNLNAVKNLRCWGNCDPEIKALRHPNA